MNVHRLTAISMACLAGLAPAASHAGDGAVLFKQRCAVCHATEAGKKSALGPNLSGVYGRGAAAGAYGYSPALRKAKIQWDARTLDTWLSAPSKMVPGTRMFISVPKPEDRKAIVTYLMSLKGK
jgi:cytochrome c